MSRPDLNLLVTLDVLLAEGSVARAAQRLRLSPSAMSRALARLRETTGDPLLVRAGRGLVPTPRALELREQVGQLVQAAEAALRPVEKLDLKRLVRMFTLRTSEGFVENFGPDLIARVGEEAPGVRLCFVQKPEQETARRFATEASIWKPAWWQGDGAGTACAGIVPGPLHRRRANGASAEPGRDHACPLCERPAHLVSRRGFDRGPIDEALKPLGLEREIVTIVGGFSTALVLARASDLIASVPERHTGNLRAGMHSFPLPSPLPSSRFPCSGTRGWMPIQRIAGCADCVREVCAPSSTAGLSAPPTTPSPVTGSAGDPTLLAWT
jgi:DNA-binding transcriptional LysR family regulator